MPHPVYLRYFLTLFFNPVLISSPNWRVLLGFWLFFNDQASLTKGKEKHNMLCKKNVKALYQVIFPFDKPIMCVISVDKVGVVSGKVWKKSLEIKSLLWRCSNDWHRGRKTGLKAGYARVGCWRGVKTGLIQKKKTLKHYILCFGMFSQRPQESGKRSHLPGFG